jgi:hypothetical protein
MTILYIVYHKMWLDPNPKLTESNQNSEFWIGSGFDPTKNVVWIRGGAEKNPTGRFGLDLVKFGPAVEMHLVIRYSVWDTRVNA